MDLADELEPEVEEIEVEELAAETEEVVKQEIEEPQPEPESKPEEKHESKQVPLHELVAERKKRQEAQRRQEESDKKVDLVLEKLRAIEEEKNKPVTPEFETDPFGYTFHQQEQIRQTAEQNTQNVEQLQSQFNDYMQQTNALQSIGQIESEYVAQNPDYRQAEEFMRTLNKNVLLSQGVPEEDIPMIIANNRQQAMLQAYNAGINPAQAVHNLAKAYGYQPESGQEENTTAQNESNNADNELNRLEKGQKHAKIGSSGNSKLDEVTSESGLDEIQAALNDIFN